MAEYIFDTNIFLTAKNELPSDVWPTFWSRLSEMINAGMICSSEKVKAEIEQGKDELVEWMRANTTSGFYIPADKVMTAVKYS